MNPRMNLILESLHEDIVALLSISDTWNMIEKYKIKHWKKDSKGNIIISQVDFQRMLDGAKNKDYINKLRVGVGSKMYGKGSFDGGTIS